MWAFPGAKCRRRHAGGGMPAGVVAAAFFFRREWRRAGAYAPFSLTATAPAGAEIARIVYAIQSFSPGPTNTGTVYVDDLTFVPEPSSLTLLLARRRRRR
jgi:hypothetical protein